MSLILGGIVSGLKPQDGALAGYTHDEFIRDVERVRAEMNGDSLSAHRSSILNASINQE